VKFTFTKDGRNLWLVFAFNALMILWIYFLSEVSYVRLFLAVVYVLFLPGYSLVELVFMFDKDVTGVERIAYSFGFSIAAVILLSYLLDYSPWGIRLEPLLIGISLFTIVCIILATVRKFKNQFKPK
jgi:uncharacterized membrane protein